MDNNKPFVHMCCGPCGTTIEFLPDGTPGVLFFFNPNISPKEEYDRRLEAAKTIAKDLGIVLIEGEYDHDKWLCAITGLEEEPEGGKRCERCFKYRLNKAAETAVEFGFKKISTTLYASPFKDNEKIYLALESAALKRDITPSRPPEEKITIWKKALQKTKESGIYRQKYCGCEFSIKEEEK